jgi:hypothetical protein
VTRLIAFPGNPPAERHLSLATGTPSSRPAGGNKPSFGSGLECYSQQHGRKKCDHGAEESVGAVGGVATRDKQQSPALIEAVVP